MYYLSILISLLLVFAFFVWYYEPESKQCKSVIAMSEADDIVYTHGDPAPTMLYQPYNDDHLEYDEDSGNLEIVVRKKATMRTLSIPDHVTLQ